MMTTILLTGAGGAGTIAIIKSLKKKFRIIAVDAFRFSVGLYLADKGYVVPPSDDPEYFNYIENIAKKEKVDIIIPLIDEELLLFKKYFSRKKGVKILLPNYNFIKLCLDKWALSQSLKKRNIECARTYLLNDFDNLPKNIFPCIIKPRVGRGSRGFAYLKNKKDLNDYLRIAPNDKSSLIIQERLYGNEFTVSVAVSKHGKIIAVVPKEVIIKKGITQVGTTRDDKNIYDLAKKVQEVYKPNGPFNIQLIMSSKTKSPKIFEINPRFSTTVALTIASGVNEVELLIKDILDQPYPVPHFKKDLMMIRYQEQYYVASRLVKKIYEKK